jgi:hypothetical protein
MSHFTAVLDANVLHSYPLSSLLLELADARLFRPAWSADIHAEWMPVGAGGQARHRT